MSLTIGRHGVAMVATISGDVDMANCSSLSAGVMAAVGPSTNALVVDLSDVRYLDSTGIQMLFDLARALDAGRRAFGIVVGESSPLRSVLTISHIDEVAVLCTRLTECLESVTLEGH